MANSKYITYMGVFSDTIVIFDNNELHANIAAKMKLTLDDILSAGFLNIFIKDDNEIDVICYGESISLNKKSDPVSDTTMAQKALGIYQR